MKTFNNQIDTLGCFCDNFYMNKSENNVKTKSICPKCGTIKSVIKYGKRNGIQRYKCKCCNYVFPEKRKRVKYFASKKTLLALLVSLINSDKGNLINDTIKNVPEFLDIINNYKFKEKQSTNDNVIFCYNPRILICDNDDGDIIIFRIPNSLKKPNQIKILDEYQNKVNL